MTDWSCKGCGECTKGEYYMVKDDLWTFGRGFLCVGCLEVRLGRRLEPNDFTDVPVNYGWKHCKTPRLLERIHEYGRTIGPGLDG